MKRVELRLPLLTLAFLISGSSLSFAQTTETTSQQERQERWFEDKDILVPPPAEVPVAEEPAKVEKKKERKRWRIFGLVGWEYDDNVTLTTDHKEFRKPDVDPNANRYRISSGLGLTLFRNDKYEVETTYEYSYNFHDDSLNEFNFMSNEVGIDLTRRFRLWNRPSKVSVGYEFEHGRRGGHTFSSDHEWFLDWTGEWMKNFPITVYERMAAKNFRNKGFNPVDTERDGFYHRTGFLQRYLFEILERDAELNFGYEFGFQATDGNRFDRWDHGFRVGTEFRLIEKVRFETNFYFQERRYHHWPGGPNRHDLHYKYEFILSRRFGKHVKASAFYRRADVNNLNDGVLGVFNYDRNIYGVELKFAY
jgi:hypothetical protein